MTIAQFAHAIGPPWTTIDPINLGDVPSHCPTPNRYVIVEDGSRKLRFDIYSSGDNSFSFEDARIWKDLLVVGYGSCAYCVHLPTRRSHIYRFDSYFNQIWTSEDCCLVASGEHLLRLEEAGTTLWRSETLAIDGVTVRSVSTDMIRVDCEWDPPNGRKPCTLSLSTGEVIS